MKKKNSEMKMIPERKLIFLVVVFVFLVGTTKELIVDNDSRELIGTMPSVTIGFVLPHGNLTTSATRQRLIKIIRAYHMKRKLKNPFYQINPIYAKGNSIRDIVEQTFCSPAAQGLNSILLMLDENLQTKSEYNSASLITGLANKFGVATMLWSSHDIQATQDFEEMLPIHLSPTLSDQARAMVDILKTQHIIYYCLVVVMSTPGSDEIIRQLSRMAQSDWRGTAEKEDHEDHFKAHLVYTAKILPKTEEWMGDLRQELIHIRDSTHVKGIIVWSNVETANDIFSEARVLGMTTKQYLWVAGKPMDDTSEVKRANLHVPPGSVLVTYDVSERAQIEVLTAAARIWIQTVRRFLSTNVIRTHMANKNNQNYSFLTPQNVCNGNKQMPWRFYKLFYRILRYASRMSLSLQSKIPKVGRLVVYHYMDNALRWKRLGYWSPELGSVIGNNQTLTDWKTIRGWKVVEKPVYLRIVTLEEPPYITYNEMDENGRCPFNGIKCWLSELHESTHHAKDGETEESEDNFPVDNEDFDEGERKTTTIKTSTTTIKVKSSTVKNRDNSSTEKPHSSIHNSKNASHAVCCSGLCVDLLHRLASDIGFNYDLFEVKDQKWGGRNKLTGEWNGLVKALLEDEADLVLTSLKINQERAEAIEFTLPFLETGITIMVAVRPGAISPMALLEPFSPSAWFAILFGCVTAMVITATIFESIYYRTSLQYVGNDINAKIAAHQNYSKFFVFSVYLGKSQHRRVFILNRTIFGLCRCLACLGYAF